MDYTDQWQRPRLQCGRLSVYVRAGMSPKVRPYHKTSGWAWFEKVTGGICDSCSARVADGRTANFWAAAGLASTIIFIFVNFFIDNLEVFVFHQNFLVRSSEMIGDIALALVNQIPIVEIT